MTAPEKSQAAAADEMLRALHLVYAAFRALPDVIFITDAHSRILSWNDRASYILGYTPEQLVHRPLIDLIDTNQKPEWTLPPFPTDRDPGSVTEFQPDVVPLLTADGQPLPVDMRLVALYCGPENGPALNGHRYFIYSFRDMASLLPMILPQVPPEMLQLVQQMAGAPPPGFPGFPGMPPGFPGMPGGAFPGTPPGPGPSR